MRIYVQQSILIQIKDLGRPNNILNICTIIIKYEFLKYHVLILQESLKTSFQSIQIDKYEMLKRFEIWNFWVKLILFIFNVCWSTKLATNTTIVYLREFPKNKKKTLLVVEGCTADLGQMTHVTMHVKIWLTDEWTLGLC